MYFHLFTAYFESHFLSFNSFSIFHLSVLIFGFSGSVSVKEGETASLCVRKTGETELFVSVLIGLVDSSDPSCELLKV